MKDFRAILSERAKVEQSYNNEFRTFHPLVSQISVGQEDLQTVMAVLSQNLAEGAVEKPGVYMLNVL